MPQASPRSEQIPAHVGIIMDGNGRWAAQRRLPRSAGHYEGLTAAKRIVDAAVDLGIPVISLYVFSTENWKRAKEEVGYLMFLIEDHLLKELDFYRSRRVRILHSGDVSGLPASIRSELATVISETASLTKLTLNLCINYGGRDELLRAATRLAASRAETGKSGAVTEEEFRSFLDQPSLPDPDLIIRTAGERRLSNFLLWGSAYAEYHFSEALWPDWTKADLEAALKDYQNRKRLFGGKR